MVPSGFERDGTLGRVGMTVEGSPQYGARRDRAITFYSVGPRDPPDHDAVMRIGTARLRSGGPILLSGMKAIDTPGIPQPRTVIGDP